MPEAKKNISEEFNGETLDTVDVGSVDVSEQMTFVNEIYDTYPVSTAGTPSFSKPFGSAKVNTNEGTVNAGETEDLKGEYADIIEDNTQEQSLPEETEQEVREPERTIEEIAEMIKSGNDDPFNMKAEDYESDHALEALVKMGNDDPFNMRAEDYESDHDLEALVKMGNDDPFDMKAEDYESDHALEMLVRKGSDDPFNSGAEEYEIDPQLAALIRNGSENSPLGQLEELPKEEENYEDEE